MNILNIGELIKSRDLSEIKPDITLDKMAMLGPPEWWSFSDSESFDALLGYRDFEVALWLVETRVEVRRIGLTLWEASGGEPVPKAHKIRISKNTKVEVSGYLPGAEITDIKDKLQAGDIPFSEAYRDDASEIKAVLTVHNHTQLLFFLMGGRVALAEIQFYSKNPGA